MIALFWDIDGTLLTTGKAGVPAWEMAVREIVQRDFELASFRVAGLTDYQIAVRTFEMLDVDADESTIRRMVARYEALLPTELPKKQGHVMPNVREILEQMTREPDVHLYLLTGNTRGGARAKLTHYDLFKYFEGGAFAEDTGDRASIAARALTLAHANAPVGDDHAFVIGDTPHDIECANAIGARTIAVATGGYSRAELMTHRPWRVFDVLPPVEEFARLIREPRRDGASESRPA
jgi:phosphoglycolate phosphatase-like HAD superfamily hydrolase